MTTTCDGCVYAVWKRTAAGRLHPDKSGKCEWLKAHPLDMRLPAAFYLLGGPPNPCGGHIERGAVHRERCVFKQGGAA